MPGGPPKQNSEEGDKQMSFKRGTKGQKLRSKLAERLKGKKSVKNPFAVATAITKSKRGENPEPSPKWRPGIRNADLNLKTASPLMEEVLQKMESEDRQDPILNVVINAGTVTKENSAGGRYHAK